MDNHYGSIKSYIDKFGTFTIPYYQRHYVWNSANKGRNLYKFIDDICGEFAKGEMSSYFIGSLAFCSHESVCDVVDGQQRLTSLVMLLSILADNKCSSTVQSEHRKMVYPNGNFIIQEPFYLTKELEGVLGYKPYTGTGFKAGLDDTVNKIKNQINRTIGHYSVAQFDSLYKYILNNVFIISIEYTNVKDALRYFLNINSLSVELKSHEIFYTILSQALNISHNSQTINDVTTNIDEIVSKYKGIKDAEDLIYIFLNAYYAKSPYILDLPELKVGKWMSYYQIDVFGDPIVAKEFCEVFLQYLIDITRILDLVEYQTPEISYNSPLYMSYVLLNYQKFEDLKEFLVHLFKVRHNYRDRDLYTDGYKSIDLSKMEEIAKRLNLTILNNYMRDSTKRLDGFITSIELNSSLVEKLTTQQILDNINIDNVFNLTYLEQNSFQSNPKINIPDKSRLIKVVLSLQEAFLNAIANPTNHINRYFGELLDGMKYTIEHLYSVKEWSDPTRQSYWTAKGTFTNANEFDMERSKFENLSLLDLSSNASANDDPIYEKMKKYKLARAILTSENEFLIQSLVEGSPYYGCSEISALSLPERKITNISTNTWDHSVDNKDFIRKLLYLALKTII